MAKQDEYVDQIEPSDVLRLVESELAKFGSFKNIGAMLQKYSMGQDLNGKDVKIGIILCMELRHHFTKLIESLGDDPVEARTKCFNKIKRINQDILDSNFEAIVDLDYVEDVGEVDGKKVKKARGKDESGSGKK